MSIDFLVKVLDKANRVSGDVQQLCDAILSESDGKGELNESDIGKGVDKEYKIFNPFLREWMNRVGSSLG